MKFTLDTYKMLIQELLYRGYKLTTYHNNEESDSCVILRHDVDMNIDKALKFAEFEYSIGVSSSTYFFLITSDFYNIQSKKNKASILKIAEMGFEIGLHFNEKNYLETDDPIAAILKEARIMSDILDIKINSLSIHRQSKFNFECHDNIGELVNACSQRFTNDYKYLSDSRMHWRENVFEVIKSGRYPKLHILTHPFWYFREEKSMYDIIYDFIVSACPERYDSLNDNFRNLYEVISREEIL